MKPKFRLRAFLLIASSALLSISYTQAGNTWDGGGGSGSWNDPTNWNTDGLPGTGALTFTGDVQTTTTNNLVDVDPSFSGINFTNDGSIGKTSSFTLGGARITLANNITTTANTEGSTITDTIGLDLIFTGNRTITTNQLSGSVQHNLTISGLMSNNGTNRNLTKVGAGTLTLNGSVSNTYGGTLSISGGTVALDYSNMGTPTDLIPNNTVTIKGGNLTLKGKTGGGIATTQTLGTLTVNSGGATLLINPNGGDSTTLTLGTLNPTSQGISLTLGKALGAGSGTVTITTTTNKTGDIYKGRSVYANGTADTGYDWATTLSGGSPYTIEAYNGYSAMATSGTDALNSRINASTTLTGALTTNSLKIENPAASQSLDLAGNTLTLASGGLLVTGTNAFQITGSAGSTLIGQNGSGSHDLIVHQYNSGGLGIGVVIANNGANATALTKAGTGSLTLSGNNTFTGGLYINSGSVTLANAGALNSTADEENAVTLANDTSLTLNGNSVTVKSLNNVNTTDVNGGVTVQNANASATTLTVGNSTNVNSTYIGVIQDGSGGGALTLAKSGTGKLTLGGSTIPPIANTYSGGTVLNAGELEIRSNISNFNLDGNLGQAAGGLTFDGGQLTVTSANLDCGRIVTINAGGGSIKINKNNAFTTSGNLTGTGTLTLLDPGGSGTPPTSNFNSTTNDFTGGIVLNNAILNVNSLADSANNIVFNSTLPLTVLNGTSALKYGSDATAALNLISRAIEYNSDVTTNIGIQNRNTTYAINIGTNLVATGAGAKTLLLDAVDGPTNVFSGNITNGTGGGTVAVSKPNTNTTFGGTWVLSGINTYSGGTTVDKGTLLINNTTGSGTGTGAVSVTAGTLGGTGSISGAVTIGNGSGTADAILAPGTSIESLATGNLAFDSDGRYSVELDGTSVTSDVTNVTGTVSINATTTLAVNVTGTLSASQQYVIISNDAADAVTGTFSGLAEGAVVGNFGGTDLKISYTGGDGNDIVLYTDSGAGGYSDWQSANGTGGAIGEDHDDDGVDNGTEYFLGGTANTTGFTALPGVTNTGGTLSVTWTKDASYTGTYTTDFVVETSDTLTSWTTAATDGSPAIADTVYINGNDVTYTFPSGTKKFARLKVTGPN